MKHKVKNFEQIDARISEHFNVMKMLVDATVEGDCRSLIVSSPPGLGKSYTVETSLKKWDPSETRYTISRGYVLTTGLLRLAFSHRDPGQVLVFDDADSIFGDLDSINLLKAICDTTERRVVTYRTERTLICEVSGMPIPPSFEFRGSVVFLTNMDFDEQIAKKGPSSLGPHFAALVSRSHYIDLAMSGDDDYIVRIEQVRKEGKLLNFLTREQGDDVMDYIYDNKDTLRELSLRMAIKLGKVRKLDKNWKNIAKITCCRNPNR